MEKEELLNAIRGGLVVSCQARQGWPMYGTDIMVAFAKAAKQGGAVGIRATEPQNISAIKKAVDLPIIGIYKQWFEGFDVYITPTYESAAAVIEAGAEIVALDGTKRIRPNGENLKEIIARIHDNYPDILVMSDCDNLESALYAEECGTDIVSTTLSGYTEETKDQNSFNYEFVSALKKSCESSNYSRGHISTPEELVSAYKSGADSVVVGSAITRPEIITKRFVDNLEQLKKENHLGGSQCVLD